VVTII
jgi:hypothetical protein